ncbi:MAG: SAM-dependent methyltransferase [Pseudomonadales bacterium]|nr:SAM-dependent methyltransferase [Pseudomonadales bacterium]
MRLLLFIILFVVLLPLFLIGVAIFTWRIRRVCVPQNISGTANEPYASRLFMHIAGSRIDDAGYKIAKYLPSYGGIVRFLIIDTTRLACKLSGYKGWMFSYPGPRPSTLATLMSHRSYFFDESIREALTRNENPATQFVVLGAGYDTRCYDLPEGSDINCFEVDMPPTLNAKKQALELAGVPHDHVTFVETDFNQETWMEALLNSGFNPNLTTYILWEGVTMYLVEEAVRDTFNLITTLPSGSAAGVDFFSKDLIEGNPPFERISKAMHRGIKYYSENLQFGIPTGKKLSAGIEELSKESGLTLTKFEHVGSEGDKLPPWYFFSHIEKH